MTEYNTDFHAWALEQAALLKSGKWDSLDIPNLVEEVESLARQEVRDLEEAIASLLALLLEWHLIEQGRSKALYVTIREQARKVKESLKDNPSLLANVEVMFKEEYESALNKVVGATDLDYKDCPSECPYSWLEITQGSFWLV